MSESTPDISENVIIAPPCAIGGTSADLDTLSLDEIQAELKKPVEIPFDTRPISKEEFMSIMSKFRGCQDFKSLPLPGFMYETLPEYAGTELSRINQNCEYQKKQQHSKTPEERTKHMKDRLRKKLEEKRKKESMLQIENV